MKNKSSLQNQILKSIPADEKRVWNTLTALPLEQKKFIWKLIKNSNKEGLIVYKQDIKHLHYLQSKGLISINSLYKSRSGEVSLFVLRDAPYLQRMLRNMARKKVGFS